MALDLAITPNKGLMMVSIKDEETRYIRLSEQEANSLFFFLIKHRQELFTEMKNEEMKAEILNKLIAKPIEPTGV